MLVAMKLGDEIVPGKSSATWRKAAAPPNCGANRQGAAEMRPAAVAASAPAGSEPSHATPASLPPIGARPLSMSQRTLTPSRSAPQRAPAGELITNAREKRAALKAELAELERQDAAASQPETASTLESRLPRALCAAATPTAQAGCCKFHEATSF